MCALTSVHQLDPLSVRINQAGMDSLAEEGENGEDFSENWEDRDDQGFEEDTKRRHSAEVDSHLNLDIDAVVSLLLS